MSTITHLTSLKHLQDILSTRAKDKVAVIDFHATWCGPCHAIAPRYEALSKQWAQVVFLKCDVDACKDVAREYMITAMPTFIFLKNGIKVAQVRGADPRGLESMLRTHAGAPSASPIGAFSGKGQTLGGPSPAAPAATSTETSDPFALFSNLDPQVKLLAGLVLAYLIYVTFMQGST